MEDRSLIIAIVSVGIGLSALCVSIGGYLAVGQHRLQDSVGDLRERVSAIEVSMTNIETRMTRIEDILGYAKTVEGD